MATTKKSVLSLVADIGITGADTATKQLKKIAQSTSAQITFNEKAFLKGWAKTKDQVAKSWAETLKNAATAGLSPKHLQKTVSAFEDVSKKIDESKIRAEHIAAQIREKSAKGIVDEALKQQLQIEKLKTSNLKKQFEAELKHTEQIVERRLEAVKEAENLTKKFWGDTAEDFGSNIRDQFEELKSGGFSPFLKKLGQQVEARGIQAQAGQGAFGKVAGKGFGDVLAKLGPTLTALGALVGGIAAVAKIIIDADAQAKELNRTLLDTGIQAGDLTSRFGEVEGIMDRARRTFTAGEGAFSFNRIWGTTAKDHLQILGAYSEAGYTFKEMTSGVKSAEEEMEKLRSATAGALAYSKLLGQSSTEVAQHFSTYMEDLGLTLEGVQKRFSSIHLAAQESGFGVKRFFSQVLQATSGMSQYNVRLEEASSLLIQLGKVLGTKVSGDFLNQLTQGYKQAGTQERIVQSLLLGKRGQAITQRESEKTASDFLRKLTELSETNEKAGKSISDALGAKGVTQEILQSPEKFARFLGKLDEKSIDLLTGEISVINHDLARQFQQLGIGSRAFGRGHEGVQTALEVAGPAATLLAKLYRLESLTGKRIDQIKYTDEVRRLAAENVPGGVNSEEFRQIKAVGGAFGFRQARLSEYQTKIRGSKTTDEAKAAAKEFNDKYAAEFGVILTAAGERYKAVVVEGAVDFDKTVTTGLKLKDTFDDLIQSLGGEFLTPGGGKEQVSEDLLTAQEIAKNTTEMTNILEQGVQYVLEQIYTGIKGIKEFLTGKWGKLSEGEASAKEKGLVDIEERLSGIREQVLSQRRVISSEKAALNKPNLEPAEKERLSKDIKEREGLVGQLVGGQKKLKGIQSKLQAYKSGGLLFDKSLPEILEDIGSKGFSGISAGNIAAGSLYINPDKELEKKISDKAIAPKANDLVVQFGRDGVKAAHRIDSGDVGVFTKPSGEIATSRTGGGSSGTVVHNHFYNDGKGIWNSLQKYEQARGRR